MTKLKTSRTVIRWTMLVVGTATSALLLAVKCDLVTNFVLWTWGPFLVGTMRNRVQFAATENADRILGKAGSFILFAAVWLPCAFMLWRYGPLAGLAAAALIGAATRLALFLSEQRTFPDEGPFAPDATHIEVD